jgi:hypothetical protein
MQTAEVGVEWSFSWGGGGPQFRSAITSGGSSTICEAHSRDGWRVPAISYGLY